MDKSVGALWCPNGDVDALELKKLPGVGADGALALNERKTDAMVRRRGGGVAGGKGGNGCSTHENSSGWMSSNQIESVEEDNFDWGKAERRDVLGVADRSESRRGGEKKKKSTLFFYAVCRDRKMDTCGVPTR